MARKQEWQGIAYNVYQFNNVAEFGIPTSVENPVTGVNMSTFKQIAKLHFARRNQTISDRFQAAGTSYENTVLIVIRHNRTLSRQKVIYVKMDDDLFKCINYSVNNSTYNSLDLLTLKHVEKVS